MMITMKATRRLEKRLRSEYYLAARSAGFKAPVVRKHIARIEETEGAVAFLEFVGPAAFVDELTSAIYNN